MYRIYLNCMDRCFPLGSFRNDALQACRYYLNRWYPPVPHEPFTDEDIERMEEKGRLW